MIQKKQIIHLSFVLILVSLSSGDTQVPRYPCQQISETLRIDGILDEECWSQLPTVGPFVERTGVISSVQTVAMLAYDSNNLYISVCLYEPSMDKIVANKVEHDSGIWEDDDFEFLITTSFEPTKYFQFCINSIGTTEDIRDMGMAKTWNGHWKSAVRREKDGWRAEIMIPFKTLGQNCPNDDVVWRMNLCRNRVGANRHLSSWSATPSFTDSDRYGELIFLKQRLLQSVSSTIKPTPQGNNLDLQIKAKPGNYTARFFWLAGNEEIIKKEKLVVKTDSLAQFTEKFPLSEKPGFGQIELLSATKPNEIAYRSERMTTDKRYINEIMLANVKKKIDTLDKIKTPKSIDDIKRTWKNRFNVLENDGEYFAIKKLLHECKLAEFLTKLNSRWQSKTTLWFSLPSFTRTDYDYIPLISEIGGKISIAAMRGEYEPGCVNILQIDMERDIILKVNNLSSDKGEVFDARHIDIKTLKYWYQSGSEYQEDKTGNAVWTGELLLKDDSIIEPNHSIQRNIIHSIADSAKLKPTHIDRFNSRQFWLTAYIPREQKPGLYRGYVEAISGETVLAKIPIEINVLPLTLEPTKFTFTMYYSGKYSNGKDPNNDICYEEDLRVASAHGLTSMPIYEGAECEMNDGFTVSYDFSVIRKALELRKKYGLTGKTFKWGFWDTPSVYNVFQVSEEQLTSEVQHKKNVIKFCEEFAEILNETGFDGYFYTYDEPGYDSTGKALRMCRVVNQWVNEGNMKSIQAITLPAAKELDSHRNLPILDLPSGVIGEQRRVLPFKDVWFYTHPLENPMIDRLLNGLLIWYGGYTGTAPYAYNALGDWDDWNDYSDVYRPMHYAYRGENGPIVTWQYEAFREGSDDVKYLEMLEKRVKRAEEIGLDTFSVRDRKILLQARNLLDIPPAKFRGNTIQVPLKLTPTDFHLFRKMVTELLIKAEEIITNNSR